MHLRFTSVFPYFVLMGLFWCEASLIQRYVPFFRRAIQQEANTQSHNVPLDALRGILAISVFFTHALTFHYWRLTGTWDSPPSQFYSQLAVAPVAMFFMITGYLFWAKAQSKGLGPLRIYFLHRLRRLYPAFLFSSALIVLVTFWMSGLRLNVPPSTFIHSLLPYCTFALAGGPPINNWEPSLSVNAGVTWTLRVEWMFYFMLPLLALFAKKTWKQVLLAVISLALYIGLPLLRAKFHNPLGLGTLMYFNNFLFAYFSIGMLIAYCKKNFAWKTLEHSRFAAVVAILMLLGLYWIPAHEGPLEGSLVGFPLLLVVFGNSYFGLLRSRPIVLLGQSSYSVYLLHGIVLFVAGQLLRAHDGYSANPWVFWSLNVLIGWMVVALAAFSYRWFEAPFMHGYGMKRQTRA